MTGKKSHQNPFGKKLQMSQQHQQLTNKKGNQIELSEKRYKYSVQIRRQRLNKLFSQKRSEIKNELNNRINETKIRKDFLKENPELQISQNEIENQEFFILDLMLHLSQSLIEGGIFKKSNLNNNIFEKQVSQPYNIKQINSIGRYTLKIQTQLYSYLADEIYNNPEKYKKLEKTKQQRLIIFWINFLKRNKYVETSQNKQYHKAIIDFLTILTANIESPDLRKLILLWTQGTQSLALIFNCLDNKFLDFNIFSRIYDIILKGMKSKDFEKKANSIDVLLKAIRMSDFDDIEQLLHKKSQIFTQLVNIFTNSQITVLVSQNQTKNQEINYFVKAAYCVNLFLSTYDQYVLECLKQGAGYVGAWLICQQNPTLIKQGFQIFQIIVGIQERQYRKQAQGFLLTNPSIQETGVWQKMVINIQYSDKQIKNYFVSFVDTFLCNSQLIEINSFYLKFNFWSQNGEKYTLIDILIRLFVYFDDQSLRIGVLRSFVSILFYQNKEIEEQYFEFQDLDQWDQNYKKISINADMEKQNVKNKIQSKNMKNKMDQLFNMENINSELHYFMDQIFQILKFN